MKKSSAARTAAFLIAAALLVTGAPAAASATPTAAAAGASPRLAPVAPVATAKKKTKRKATLKVLTRTKGTVAVGNRITLSGTASRSLKGKRVHLQLKVGKKWQSVASGKVSKKLKFSVKATATKAGSQKYRVYAKATKTTKSAKSASYGYRIWKWYRIGGRHVNESNLETWGNWTTPSIAGKTYADSATIGWGLGGYNRDGWAEYNVNYKCTKFRSTIGLSDESKSDAKRTFSIGVDDTTTSFGTRGIGAGLPVTADIKGSYRIRLSAVLGGNTAWGMAVFGTPQVFCSSAP